MRNLISLSVLLFVLSSARASVVEIHTMKEILPELSEQTLLLFDLDNTLMETVQSLGSDQWFDHVLAKRGMGAALDLWKKVQLVSKMEPVEKSTPKLIAQQQARGIRILGLTARPLALEKRTLEQLNSVEIDLSKSSGFPEAFVLKEDMNEDLVAKVSGGVVFSGNNPKGEILTRLFQDHLKPRPGKIVFVDDKKANVDSVEAALGKMDIPHISFRYGAADKRVRAYEDRVAEKEMEYFGGILTDQAARKLMAK